MTPRPRRLDGASAEEIADVMFALSAPSRIEILRALADGALTVNEIVDAVGMEQSAVSHQLRVLREHELVRVERDGKRRLYAQFDDAVGELLAAAIDHVNRRVRPHVADAADGAR